MHAPISLKKGKYTQVYIWIYIFLFLALSFHKLSMHK